VAEVRRKDGRATLTDADGERELPAEDAGDNVFLSFVRFLAGRGEHPIGPLDPFRVTEVALKAREAADALHEVPLLDSPYSKR
jgi:hypothetical protein